MVIYGTQNLQSVISTHNQDIKFTYWNIQGRLENNIMMKIVRRKGL